MTTTGPLGALTDVNLRLAVLDALVRDGHVPPFDKDAFDAGRPAAACACPADDCDCDDDCDCTCCSCRDYRYRPEVVEALLAVPVTAEQCASVRAVDWDVNDTVFDIWTYFDGESDEFDIRALDGVGSVLPALESLEVVVGAVTDLSPLASCPRLRELSVDGDPASVTDLAPLAGSHELRSLRLSGHQIRDLGPLSGLSIEHLTIDGNCDADHADLAVDLAPLAGLTTLRRLSCHRTVYTAGSTPAVRTAYDNARVIETLRARGVTVSVG